MEAYLTLSYDITIISMHIDLISIYILLTFYFFTFARYYPTINIFISSQTNP